MGKHEKLIKRIFEGKSDISPEEAVNILSKLDYKSSPTSGSHRTFRKSNRQSVTIKTIQNYLNLPYTYIIEWSDVDECFLGSIVELERNMTCGQTREEVLSNLKEALTSYVTTSLENKMEIPEPLKIDEFKGNITYRTSRERHYKLAKQAKLFGKSINTFIDEASVRS